MVQSGLQAGIGRMEDWKIGRINEALMAVIDLEGCGPSQPLLYKHGNVFCGANGAAPSRKPPIALASPELLNF